MPKAPHSQKIDVCAKAKMFIHKKITMKKMHTRTECGRPDTALEIATERKYFRSLFLLFFACSTLFFTACEEKEDVNPDDQPLEDVDLDAPLPDHPVSKGHIGLVLDARTIAKKGYKPAYASVIIDGPLSSFSDDHIEIDEFTNLATLRISRDSISEDALDQFIRGVSVTITVFDEGNEILSETKEENLPVNASARPFSLKTKKQKIKRPLKIIAGAPYIIVTKPIDGYEGGTIWSYHLGSDPLIMLYDNLIQDGDVVGVGQEFTFESAGNDSTFYIKATDKGQYIDIFQETVQTFTDKMPNLPDNYKFILVQDDEGWITIKSHIHKPLKIDFDYLRTSKGIDVKFKLISADIEWQAQDVGIAFENPIMPPAKADLAINTLINNCAPSTITQTVGKEDTRVTTVSLGAEESFSLTTSHEARVDASVSIGVSADLFGVVGVEKNYSLSAGYTYTNTSTNTSTKRFETSTTTETRVSFQREVLVHPYTAVHVYDAVQTYENVQMPYVQKLRVSAIYNGTALTGEEIISQLTANQFGGVVAETGSNYVIITVRGMIQIQNLMEVRTDSSPIPCPNVPG